MYKVLIVDDFEADRTKLKKTIHSFNNDSIDVIGLCETGREALNFIEDNKPDIIISDIEMPFMNGLEMAKIIREKYNNSIKIIFCTLYNEFKYAKEAIYANSYGYILKPIQAEELSDCLKRVMEIISNENRAADEYNYLQETLKAFKPIMADNFLKEILYGINSNRQDIWEKMKYFDIYIKKGFFSVLYIELDDFETVTEGQSTEEKQLFSLKVFDRIKNTLAEYVPFPVTRLDEMHLAVIVSESDEAALKNSVYYCGKKIIDMIERSGISASVIVSDHSDELFQIKNLFEQCKYILRYKFSIGKGKIISSNDIPSGTGTDSIDKNQLQKDIRFLLNSGSKQEIMQYIDQQIGGLAGKADTNTLKNYCFLIVICLRLVLNENNLNLADIFEDEGLIWEKLQRFETILDAGNWLKNLLVFSKEHISKKNSSKNNVIVEEIKKFVYQNINRNIGLDDLANELHYSPNYLNYIFKHEAGITINDYVTGVKMEKAKELLADVRYKVQDISEALGYNHVAYFCSVFKKNTGITPKEYRERMI